MVDDNNFKYAILGMVGIDAIVACFLLVNEKTVSKEQQSAIDLYEQENIAGSAAAGYASGEMREEICDLWDANVQQYGGCKYLRTYAPSRYWTSCGNMLHCAISFAD